MTVLADAAFRHAASMFQPRRRRWATPGEMAVALDPTTVQTPALDLIDRELVALADGDIDRLMVCMPPQEGKLVADDTLVPTPDGWARHGDLHPGSVVFHPSGQQIKVAEVHPPAEASLRVHFSDHTSILAHPAHEWTVWDRGRAGWVTLETRRLAAVKLSSGTPGKRGHGYRFHLPLREPLDCPDANLPVEPYTLGVWLGDGTTTKAAVTHHPDDRYELAYPKTTRCVHATTGIITTYFGGGMLQDLREAGVLGNKHIPAPYLRASIKQRRALLAGLIDTDGHVAASGQVSFDNANADLVHSVAELIRSLGYRAHVHRPTPPKLSSSGIQGKQEMWRVTFTPHDQGPARLERKAARKLGRRERIAITAITEEAPQVGRCITVDSEDGLYLVGPGMLPTHNSVRVSHRFAEWLLIDNPDLRIAIVSYADEMARRWGSDIKLDAATFNGDDDTIDLGLRLRADSRAAGRWQIDGRKGGVYCVGVAGALTGKPVDVLLWDDPLKDMAEAQSSKYRERAWRFWQAVAVPRLGPGSKVVLVSTRWHEDDPAGRLLAEDPGAWRVVKIPAIAESPDDPLGRQVGEPMVSARGERDWARIRRSVGEYVWAALYQQRPAPADGGLFKRSGLRHWVSGGEQRLRLGDRIVDLRDCWKFLTVDLAASTKTSADYTAAAVWAIGPAGDLVMLDGLRERLDPAGHWPAVRSLRERWSADVVFVESRMFGTTLVYEAAQGGVPVQELHADADKITRALPATARADSGQLWFPPLDRMPEIADWRDELLAFPNGTHDDCVDVVAYAARVAGAHWLPAESSALADARRTPSDDGVIGQAYAAATGGSGDVDFMSVNY